MKENNSMNKYDLHARLNCGPAKSSGADNGPTSHRKLGRLAGQQRKSGKPIPAQ